MKVWSYLVNNGRPVHDLRGGGHNRDNNRAQKRTRVRSEVLRLLLKPESDERRTNVEAIRHLRGAAENFKF